MDKTAAMKIMHSTGWLSRQPEAFRNEVLRSSRFMTFAAGEALYNFQDDTSGVFGLVDGVIEIQLANGNVGTVGTPGYWVGEAAGFKRMPRGASLVARTSAAVLYLPLVDFERIISNAEYCRCFATLTVEHLEEALAVVANLMVNDSMQRVCGRLLNLLTIDNRGGSQMEITQEDLASMCGLSRQTVNKVIGRLIEDGIVASTYGQISIIDEARLRKLVHLGDK
jgi:CRP-like cAMP-binding protein